MITNLPFTKELLKEKIDTGQNIVFSYPAGSGKTTAIRDYIVEQIQTQSLTRKIIYVAPTKTLLDNMYDKLIEAGLRKTIIFNFHSDSEDYKACKKKGFINSQINLKIENAAIVLITHERMKFDVANRFIGDLDQMFMRKPLVFLDESIEDCNVARLTIPMLEAILLKSGLITVDETYEDYKLKDKTIEVNTRLLRNYLTTPIEYSSKTGQHTIPHLNAFAITLSNNVGFSDKANMLDPTVESRFKNLYTMLSMAIAQANWLEHDGHIYVNLPIAIHESWKHHAQIVVTDATAFINSCMCKDYEVVSAFNWQADLLNNYVSNSRSNTRTKLESHPESVIQFLEQIDLTKYNKIYIVTFKSKLLTSIRDYLQQHYSNYQIEYNDSKSTEEFLESDIDNSTDELYTDSSKVQKIIYLTNFGRTRGSNKFRECDCVIQIGNYRINPEALDFLTMLYPGLESNQLALTNYLQELYRGCIRCRKPMDSYSLIESNFLYFMQRELKELKFKFKPIAAATPITDKYGKNQELVDFLYKCKNEKKLIQKEDLMEIYKITRFDLVKVKILNLYKKYPKLRNELFEKFSSVEFLNQKLSSKKCEQLNFQIF